MTDQTSMESLQARVQALRDQVEAMERQRAARANQPGYASNVADIDKAITSSKADLAQLEGSDGPATDQP